MKFLNKSFLYYLIFIVIRESTAVPVPKKSLNSSREIISEIVSAPLFRRNTVKRNPEVIKPEQEVVIDNSKKNNQFKNKNKFQVVSSHLRPIKGFSYFAKKQEKKDREGLLLEQEMEVSSIKNTLKDFAKDAQITGWRNKLTNSQKQRFDDYVQKIAYDDIGRPIEMGSFVKADSLLNEFSSINYIKEKQYPSRINEEVSQLVGNGRQFSDKQSLLDALDKERFLLENFIRKTIDESVRKAAIEKRDAYDRLISYLVEKERINPQSQKKIYDKNFKDFEVGKQFILSDKKNNAIEINIRSMIKTVEGDIYAAYRAFQKSLNEIKRYEVMRNDYINKLIEVESSYNLLKNQNPQFINQSQVNDYNIKVNQLEFLYKKIEKNKSKAESAYTKVIDESINFQKVFNNSVKLIKDSYPSYSDVIKKELNDLTILYEKMILKKFDIFYQKVFFKNLSDDVVLLHKNLLFNVKNNKFDYGEVIREKRIEKFYEAFKKNRLGTMQPASFDCNMFDSTYLNFNNSAQIFFDKIKSFESEVKNFKEDSDISSLEDFKIRLDNFYNELNQLYMKVKANCPSESSPLAVCFVTASHMIDLLDEIEKIFKIFSNINNKFIFLEKKVEEYQKRHNSQ